MIAFGIKRRGEGQHFGRTELYAEAAGLTSLDNNSNASFCHEYPQKREREAPEGSQALWIFLIAARCDAGHIRL